MDYFKSDGQPDSLLTRLLYLDIKTYLVELLMKQDQMSMAASIESRVPFLDHKLVEFAIAHTFPIEGALLVRQIPPAASHGRPAFPPKFFTAPKWDSRPR